MTKIVSLGGVCGLVLAIVAAAVPAADNAAGSANDWPQWRGPQRSGISAETGLLKEWPKEGPAEVWKAENLGAGYSTVSISAGKVFTQGKADGQELVFCLDERTGSRIWAVPHEGGDGNAVQPRGDGPRGAPTVEGTRLYAISPTGVVSCLETETGKAVWHVHLQKDLGGKKPNWGFCESPLIDGDHVIVTPGGKDGTVAALKKETGEVVWRSEVTDAAHYCSAIVVEDQGVRQILQFTSNRVVGLNAENGKLLWSYDKSANRTANVSTPIYSDGAVFSATAYNTGGGLVKLAKNGDAFSAEPGYFIKEMENHHGGMVLVDGYIYGFGSRALMCIDFKTGEIAWRAPSVGKGSLCYADGHLYCLGERQQVALVEANPKQYVEKGRFSIPAAGQPSWSHPVVANGKLFIRDQETLKVFDVREKK